MQLVADRFALDDTGAAIDLATGARVTLVVEPAGEVPQQLRWNERCETLHSLRHHALAPLTDYGLTGASSRFEAWACAPGWRGSPDQARSVRARATSFLRAIHVSVDRTEDRVGTAANGTGLLVPDAGTGYPIGSGSPPHEGLSLVDHGVRMIDRPAVAALAEIFGAQFGSRSHVASLWGPRESGKRSAIAALARAARLQGFVPIAVGLVGSVYAPLWAGRSVFVIGAQGDFTSWAMFVHASLRVALPHALLLVGESECRAADGVPLRGVAPEALLAALRPEVVGGPFEAAARRVVDEARGLPGRFVRRLWRQPRDERATVRAAHPASIAAEQPAAYGGGEPAAAAAASSAICAWPAPGELAALRQDVDSALSLLAAGRHAPGVRELRQAVSGLARRGAWQDAAAGGVHLAGALLRRGRPVDAQKAIDEAREYAVQAGGEALVDLAILSGAAWIDRARLDEAEGILATAVAAARAAGDSVRLGTASLSLGRCLFWRGRYAEACVCLERVPDAMPTDIQARRSIVAAKLAVARGDFAAAMADASVAAQLGAALGNAALKATAAYTKAFVHTAVGDFDAADHELAEAIAEARDGHDPLRSLRARLLRAEVERRRGRVAAATSQVARLRRAVATAPPLTRLRWQLASALCARGDLSVEAVVQRHVVTTGVGALALYASSPASASGGPATSGDPFLEHVLSILRVCQTAAEDAVVLKDICVRVRQDLHAASAAFVAVHDGRAQVIAADGMRIDSDIAERAVAAGITIAPHRREDRLEAAAPVLYGGGAIAAVAARWTLGSTYDVSRAAATLTMTAAAAAPVVALAIQKAEQRGRTDDSELLGVSAAIAELRRSVERAAAAPFGVLIDGESGSGKELVARAIHRRGGRRHKTFGTLNCAALPDDLIDAELFGHARGSFTGAIADRAGVFEDANGGSLFLDEIGELSPRAQAKVLRVIQEGELRRVGETASRRIDVRIIAATNRDLRREVDAGRFRLDLLYRLDVVHVAVPPLRERREDIPVLAEHFWRDATARVGSRATLGMAAVAALARHDWPGNVRELQNVLAALAVRCPKRGVVPASALPPAFAAPADARASRLEDARRTFEERFVRAALVRTGGHRGRAAEELGVTRQGLTKLMTRLGIST